MTLVSPPELERELPGPQESIRVTRAPRRRRWRAVQPPKAPAPMTATWGFTPPPPASRAPRAGPAPAHSGGEGAGADPGAAARRGARPGERSAGPPTAPGAGRRGNPFRRGPLPSRRGG